MEFADVIERPLMVLALALPRMLVLFTVVPVLGSAVLPGMVRAAVAVSLALFVYPLVDAQVPAGSLSWPLLVALMAKEVFLGFVIGYLLAMVFWLAASVGAFLDVHRGAMMAETFNPLLGGQGSPLANLLVQTVTAVFFVGGGALAFLKAFYLGYAAWPVFEFVPLLQPRVASFFIDAFEQLAYMMVLVAGPLVLAMFLAEICFALVSRFVPQLNVFFLAFPIKSAVAVFLLVFYTAIIVSVHQGEFAAIPTKLLQLQQLTR